MSNSSTRSKALLGAVILVEFRSEDPSVPIKQVLMSCQYLS